MWIATRAIVASGSYGPSPRSYRADVDLPKGAQEASGVDEVVRAVREQAPAGRLDQGVCRLPQRAGWQRPCHLHAGRARCAGQAAHASGRKVSAHASTDEGMRRATLAGVDTIEHGYGGSEATFRLMAERGAYFPTLTAPEATSEYFQKYQRGGAPTPSMQAAARAFRLARKWASPSAMAATSACLPTAQCARTGMDGKAGHDAAEALRAATVVNAAVLDRATRWGRSVPAIWPIWWPCRATHA
jgi:imidazolonepropionase-like amidohydrolase